MTLIFQLLPHTSSCSLVPNSEPLLGLSNCPEFGHVPHRGLKKARTTLVSTSPLTWWKSQIFKGDSEIRESKKQTNKQTKRQRPLHSSCIVTLNPSSVTGSFFLLGKNKPTNIKISVHVKFLSHYLGEGGGSTQQKTEFPASVMAEVQPL